MKLTMTRKEAERSLRCVLIGTPVLLSGSDNMPDVEVHDAELEQDLAIAQRQLNVARDRVAWLEREHVELRAVEKQGRELVDLLLNPAVQKQLLDHYSASGSRLFVLTTYQPGGGDPTLYHIGLGTSLWEGFPETECAALSTRKALLDALRDLLPEEEDLPSATPLDAGTLSPMAKALMQVDADDEARQDAEEGLRTANEITFGG